MASSVSNETDDIGGTQGAEVDGPSVEAMDEEVSSTDATVTNRAWGESSVVQQKLLESGHEVIGRNGLGGNRRTQSLLAQIGEQLAKCGDLVAPRHRPAVASRLITTTMELVDVCFVAMFGGTGQRIPKNYVEWARRDIVPYRDRAN